MDYTLKIKTFERRDGAELYYARFEGSGWAILILDEGTGMVAIHSDWGDWTYSWPMPGRGTPSLKRFLGKCDYHYLAGKFCRERYEFDVFAYCATDPRDMLAAADPVGPDNDACLAALARDAATVWVGWGVHGAAGGRGESVLALLRSLGIVPVCLGVTRGGQPRHPLYVGYDVPLQHLPLAYAARTNPTEAA